MDSLLRWSIEHSTPRSADAPPPARRDINPEIIDHILGKPDAVLMKEALGVALDENRDEAARIQALDDFEMLVEQIDNANGAPSCCFVLLPGFEPYTTSFRPCEAEDVGSIAIPSEFSELVRRSQSTDTMDHRHRGPKQSCRSKLRRRFVRELAG